MFAYKIVFRPATATHTADYEDKVWPNLTNFPSTCPKETTYGPVVWPTEGSTDFPPGGIPEIPLWSAVWNFLLFFISLEPRVE